MKTKILFTIIGAAALAAITPNVNAGDALLSPRTAGNQIKTVSGVNSDVNLVSTDHYTVSPRAAGNQTATVAGMETPAVKCQALGSPKYVATAGKSARMSCCNLTLADCSTMNDMPKSK